MRTDLFSSPEGNESEEAKVNVKVLKERCRVAMTAAMKEADQSASSG